MNCSEWEERVALYAGGDLASEEVERHVAECASCQLLLSGLRQTLALVQTTHSEPVDPAHFAAVRSRVLAEIEHGTARRWRFVWMYGMAAAAVVLVIAMWPRPELRLALQAPAAPSAPAVARVILPAAQEPRKAVTETVTMTMKIETDNPDVVIYWITDSKGDTK